MGDVVKSTQRTEGEAIEAENVADLQELAGQGLQFQGLGEHYVASLLEAICDALEVKDIAYLEHQRWLRTMLDNSKAQAAEQARILHEQELQRKWMGGVVPTNGSHKPIALT